MHVGNFLKFSLLIWKRPHHRPLRLACEGVPTGSEGLRSTSCNINHPIFQEGTKVSSPSQILVTLLLCPDPFPSLTPL